MKWVEPRMISNHDLHQIAYDLGVSLARHDGGPKGWYSPSMRTISTRRGMAIWDYKSTLAHELGHAHYQDRYTGQNFFDNAQERRADRYAARLLIDTDDLRDLAPWHRDDLDGLAADLEVTPHLLRVLLDTLALRGTP